MKSGRQLLVAAAQSLLANHPDREPSTREIYEMAGVAAPTLYHHFGTKDGLMEAVVEDAFSTYLTQKRSVPHTGDLLADFAAGWNKHIEFGVNNPVLYRLMYLRPDVQSTAAGTAESELRLGLEPLADAGLLRLDVDTAVTITTASAIGCVLQLHRTGGSATDPLVRTMRAALLGELTGKHTTRADDPRTAATALISWLGTAPSTFTAPEVALLHQWLLTISDSATSQTVSKGSDR